MSHSALRRATVVVGAAAAAGVAAKQPYITPALSYLALSAAAKGAAVAVGRSAGFASVSPVSANRASALTAAAAATNTRKLADMFSKELVDSIYRSSFKNQTGVSLKYMMDFGAQPIQRWGPE
jgi:hypothetical protein